MNRPAFTTTLFLSCMLAASAALANTEIVKCVDAAGHTVLTDQPCQAGTEMPLVPAKVEAAPDAAATAPTGLKMAASASSTIRTATRNVERFATTAQEPPSSVWAKNTTAMPSMRTSSRPAMSADAAMLRTARLKLIESDNAASQMRQQRLAGLN